MIGFAKFYSTRRQSDPNKGLSLALNVDRKCDAFAPVPENGEEKEN